VTVGATAVAVVLDILATSWSPIVAAHPTYLVTLLVPAQRGRSARRSPAA
jgi:hypothetical protein